jgi:hypothetical protein
LDSKPYQFLLIIISQDRFDIILWHHSIFSSAFFLALLIFFIDCNLKDYLIIWFIYKEKLSSSCFTKIIIRSTWTILIHLQKTELFSHNNIILMYFKNIQWFLICRAIIHYFTWAWNHNEFQCLNVLLLLLFWTIL